MDPLACVEAFVHSRSTELERALTACPDEGPWAKTLRVMIAFLARPLDWTQIDPLLDAALMAPPESRDVQICLLNIAYHRAMGHLDHDEMERLHRRMVDCLGDLSASRTRGIVHRIGFWLAEHHHDPVLAQRAALRGLNDAEEGSDLWLEFLCKYTQACIGNHDFDGIESLLSRLEERRQDLARCKESWPLLRLWCDVESGHPERALERIARWRQEQPSFSIPIAVHINALITSDRLDEAEQMVMALECGQDPLPDQDDRSAQQLATLLRVRLAIARKDLAKAREAERRTGPRYQSGLPMFLDPLRPSLQLALWSGQVDQATTLLNTLDPRRDRGDLLMEWTRLHLLRFDFSAAMASFARLLAKRTPSLVEERLRFAYEVEARSLARLYHATRDPVLSAAPPMALAPVADRRTSHRRLIGQSPIMDEVRRLIGLYAPLAQPVLILGETGTGKEVVARELHHQGLHPTAPFLALNCAAIPDALAEAELFGHVKGSFTGAVADHPGLLHAAGEGCLLLDEINSMSVRLQGLLLRVLETGEYLQIGGRGPRRTAARFLIAVNQDLEAMCEAGTFRRDLFYRLQRFLIHLPPLRQRGEDLPELCRRFLAEFSGRDDLVVDGALMTGWMEYAWPGNVRELRNEIERMVLLRGDRTLFTIDDCRQLARRGTRSQAQSSGRWTVLSRPSAALEAVASGPDIPGPPRVRERRRRLLALFDTAPRLYREEIVQALGCAPNTATADLAVLEAAGLIRRIATSGNLRTSYFVRNRSDGG